MTAQSRILIIDYGSQYTQLIARRVREARVYSEIHPPTCTIEWIREWNPTGIILSGGPNSVYGENAPSADLALFDIAPVLGAFSPYTELGPPLRMMPVGFHSLIHSIVHVGGWISE